MYPTSQKVIFSGNRMKKEGMSFDAARAACRRLNQIDNWVGKRVPVRAVPTTVADGRRAVAEAEVFIRAQTEKCLAKAKGQPPKKLTTPPPTAPRGRGMTRRADRYYAQKSQKPGKANDDVDALARGAERITLLETNTPNTPSEYGLRGILPLKTKSNLLMYPTSQKKFKIIGRDVPYLTQ